MRGFGSVDSGQGRDTRGLAVGAPSRPDARAYLDGVPGARGVHRRTDGRLDG